ENGRVTHVNAWEPLGYDPTEAPTDVASVLALTIHPEDQARVGRTIQAYLDGETREYQVEFRAPHRDGSTRWRLARGTVLRDPQGRPIRFIGSAVDITDLKRAEEALRQANARLDMAVRSSNICIWECDMPDGRIENAHLTLINLWESLGYDA